MHVKTIDQEECICPLCKRQSDLTFHHLIPKKVHRRNFFKKNFSKQELNQGIKICRTCHSGIHKRYDEMTLAKQLNSLDKLKGDEQLNNFFNWVARQRIQKT